MDNKTPLLERLNGPDDLRGLTNAELERLATETRERIIEVCSRNGGHLAPSLGTVELTLALLSTFDLSRDKLVWDVGHQSYAYKILTGRNRAFDTLRQKDGLAGFPRMSESPYDFFGVGHSSTSISAALGMATARDLKGLDNHVIAVIGDGALTGGEAFEGLNLAGHLGKRLIVVLNDNEMSIAPNVGAISRFLSRNLSRRWFRQTRKDVLSFLRTIPRIGGNLAALAEPNPSGHTQTDGTMEVTDLDKTEENRELVKNFLYDVMQGNNLDKTPDYFDGDAYIQHNSGIADGVSGLNAALGALAEQGISMVYDEVHMILAQGNFVLAVSEGTFGGAPTSYYDLWRVENGKIAEHWDVMEAIADQSTWQNQNGKF